MGIFHCHVRFQGVPFPKPHHFWGHRHLFVKISMCIFRIGCLVGSTPWPFLAGLFPLHIDGGLWAATKKTSRTYERVVTQTNKHLCVSTDKFTGWTFVDWKNHGASLRCLNESGAQWKVQGRRVYPWVGSVVLWPPVFYRYRGWKRYVYIIHSLWNRPSKCSSIIEMKWDRDFFSLTWRRSV